MKQSLTQLVEQGKSYEEAVDAINQTGEISVNCVHVTTIELMWGGSMLSARIRGYP